jgi:hypothetical protein
MVCAMVFFDTPYGQAGLAPFKNPTSVSIWVPLSTEVAL